MERASRLYLDWIEVEWEEGGGYYSVDSLSQGMPDVDKQICGGSCLVCVGRGSVANGQQSMRNRLRRYLEDRPGGFGRVIAVLSSSVSVDASSGRECTMSQW